MRSPLIVWLGTGAVLAAAIALGFAVLPPLPVGEGSSRPPAVAVAESVRWMGAAAEFIDENGAPPWRLDSETRPEPGFDSTIATAERQWESIVQSFPDAPRPEAEFVSWTTRLAIDTDQSRCLQGAGIEVVESVTSDGTVDGLEYRDPTGRTETITAIFACSYITHPQVPFEYEQAVDWEWRYYSEVVIPCLEAHGVRQRPLPAFELQLELMVLHGIGWTPTLPTENVDRIVGICRPFG